jgi:hypothetical protein
MQHPWWFPVGELTRHLLVYSTLFSLFVLAALYGGIKSSPRVFFSPWVGAIRGTLKEKARIDAEIDAYIAREFNDGSGGVKR